MIVVGGTYTEEVVVPNLPRSQGGSGIRAAKTAGKECDAFYTALEDGTTLAESALSSKPHIARRESSVTFRYVTPISVPSIRGRSVKADPINVDGDNVLCFGMIEDVSRTVRAKRLVLDPQTPAGLRQNFLEGIKAEEVVLSANRSEIASLLENPDDPWSNAVAVRAKYDLAGVVVRVGASGSYAVTKKDRKEVPAHPTGAVWSIGSGDTYSAALSVALSDGADLIEAAEIASNVTAWWCGTRDPNTPADLLSGKVNIESKLALASRPLVGPSYAPRIYVAGPFFTTAEHMQLDSVLRELYGLGARPFSPFHRVGPGEAKDVAPRDIEGLMGCDVLLAFLDHDDPGTLYEAGWAAARGIPVVGYRSRFDEEGDKMLIGMGAELHSDLTSALYRAVWVAQGAAMLPGANTPDWSTHG